MEQKRNSKYGEEVIIAVWGKQLGLREDCEELRLINKLYQGYMTHTAERRLLLKQFKEVAPKIVDIINNSEKKSLYFKYIGEVADKCVKLVALGENERAMQEYKFMVLNFKKEFDL